MSDDSKDMPTDPLADASTGVVRRSRGAFQKSTPARRPERRRPNRDGKYPGPERRESEEPEAEGAIPRPKGVPGRLFGLPRWLVIAGAVWVAALALAMVLIFTY